ncbi:MAG: sensor histidine kinase, partial [Hyphomicrobium sp.]
NTQIISDRLTDSPDPTVQRLAPKLISSLDKAINFCNETLRFGRTDERRQRREIFLLRPLLEEVGETLRLEKTGPIQFFLEMENSLQIDADREHLVRIFTNLCGNAIQALQSREEGPKEGILRISARREDKRVLITVSDNGPGIPAYAREKLFQPFQGSKRRGGTGLGLPISAELAQEHGGKLCLLDTEIGASFELEIPDRSEDKT